MGPESSGECRRFLKLRSAESLSAGMFADAVLRLPMVEKKVSLARRVLTRAWPTANDVEDAVQQAVLSVRDYLAKSRGRDFRGTTNDDLGGWLYGRIRQHATWVLQNSDLRDKRRRSREYLAAREEASAAIDAGHYQRVWSAFLAMVGRLAEPGRTVGLDYARGEPVDNTAAKTGLSKRRIFELRADIHEMARRILEDMI